MRHSYPTPAGRRSAPAPYRARMLWCLVTIAVSVWIAACGSSSKTSAETARAGSSLATGTSGPNGGGTGSAGSMVDESKRIVAAALAGFVTGPSNGYVQPADIAQVGATSPAPQPVKADGKKHRVSLVACEQQGLCGRLATVEKAVFEKLGWEVAVSTAVFSQGVSLNQAFAQAWNTAVSSKPEVIVSLAVSGIFVQPQLAQAKQDGIKTVDVFQGPESGTGYDVYVPVSYNLQREVQAAYAVAGKNGRAHDAVIDLQGFANLATPDEVRYLKSCSGCQTDVSTVLGTDNINPVKTQALMSALVQKKNYDYVSLSTGGGANAGYEQGLRTVGTATKILTVDAIPENVDLIANGTVAAAAWIPADWAAFAGVDAAVRAVTGARQPSLTQWGIGVGLWDASNVPAKGSSWLALTDAAKKRFDFLAPYALAWGLSESDLEVAG